MGPEAPELLRLAESPEKHEGTLRSWLAMVDWVLMVLRNVYSWMHTGQRRALTQAADGMLKYVGGCGWTNVGGLGVVDVGVGGCRWWMVQVILTHVHMHYSTHHNTLLHTTHSYTQHTPTHNTLLHTYSYTHNTLLHITTYSYTGTQKVSSL